MTKPAIKSRIDFSKLMKDKIFDPAELISVEEIRKEVNKDKNILGRRTIEFYARYGLLKKSIRITGDKKAYYNKDYIFDALALILLLKTTYDFDLLKIKEFMKIIRHNPKKVVIDLFGLDDELGKKKYKFVQMPKDNRDMEEVVKDTIKDMKLYVGRRYIDLIMKHKNPNVFEIIESAERLFYDADKEGNVILTPYEPE